MFSTSKKNVIKRLKRMCVVSENHLITPVVNTRYRKSVPISHNIKHFVQKCGRKNLHNLEL